MKKLLYIDSCIKAKESKTKRIADVLINAFRESCLFDVEMVVLDETPLAPLGLAEYKKRRRLLDENRVDDPLFVYAKQFARADLIVVAAPFWDMSFPAKLKTYFENISVAGFSFVNTVDGNSIGNCKAERMIYITTRGMDICDGHVLEQASPYLKALTMFFGIKNFEMISTYGMDISTKEEVEKRIALAKEKAINIAQRIISGEK